LGLPTRKNHGTAKYDAEIKARATASKITLEEGSTLE
jgi:hypothetical protein